MYSFLFSSIHKNIIFCISFDTSPFSFSRSHIFFILTLHFSSLEYFNTVRKLTLILEINPMEGDENEIPLSSMRRTKRLLSQIPLPSTGLMLRQLPGGTITTVPVRSRRTASEQINRHDRYS